MTVTYTAEVASCSKFGCFIKLLARWRGSIYKLIWMDLLLFLTLYYSINLIYIYLLSDNSKRTFESIVYYCSSYTALIPLSFVLGFYVNLVMTRWWEQYITIPWPDSIAVFVSAHVHDQDECSRLMRRTVMRYVCVCLTIVFTMISPGVKKRFPKLKNLVDAGLLLENEKNIIESMDLSFPKYPKHWMPIVWAASIITRARKEGRIRDDFAVKTIIDELNAFRGRCGSLIYYDFISIPLVYTQVVTIAVYSFFVCSLLAHQWTDIKKDTHEGLDFYLPLFITLQFFFYMGWLKVAETLINPFGEDDDDFEVNWMIDRNLQVSYLIVDEMHHEHPELVKDQYWDEVYPNELPYEAETKREQPPEPSTAKYDLDHSQRHSLAQAASPYDSVTMSDKPRSSIASILSLRSQRFNEAFQRFSTNYSKEDVIDSKSDVEGSSQTITDIENIQHITSYTPAERDSKVVSLWENIDILPPSKLEKVSEEGEEDYTHEIEEEDFVMDEEQEEMNQTISSYESDSDSDPFERLREERLQQRYQRMNDYLERNFGPNFRIVTQPTTNQYKLSRKTKKEKEHLIAESTLKDEENFQEQDLLGNEPTLCPMATSSPMKEPDTSFMSTESNLINLLESIELSETQKEHELYGSEKQDILTEATGSSLYLSLFGTSATTSSSLPTNPPIPTEQQLRISIPSSSSSSSRISIIRPKSSTSLNRFQKQMLAPMGPFQRPSIRAIQIPVIKSTTSGTLTAGMRTGATIFQPHVSTQKSHNIPHSTEVMPITKSIGTSPLGSVISLSTEFSSETEESKIVYTQKTPSEGEYRVDIHDEGEQKPKND